MLPLKSKLLFGVKQVLDSAQVGGEEYEVMKDLLIPLGRQPEFSAQSGG